MRNCLFPATRQNSARSGGGPRGWGAIVLLSFSVHSFFRFFCSALSAQGSGTQSPGLSSLSSKELRLLILVEDPAKTDSVLYILCVLVSCQHSLYSEPPTCWVFHCMAHPGTESLSHYHRLWFALLPSTCPCSQLQAVF